MTWLRVGSVVALSSFAVIQVDASSIDVAPDGSGDFLTIQEALQAASSGDTVRVAAGRYSERLAIRRAVSVIGPGSESTTLISPLNSAILEGGLIYISGLTFSGDGDGAIVTCRGCEARFEDVRFEGGRQSIGLSGSSNVVARGCSFHSPQFVQLSEDSRADLRYNVWQGAQTVEDVLTSAALDEGSVILVQPLLMSMDDWVATMVEASGWSRVKVQVRQIPTRGSSNHR